MRGDEGTGLGLAAEGTNWFDLEIWMAELGGSGRQLDLRLRKRNRGYGRGSVGARLGVRAALNGELAPRENWRFGLRGVRRGNWRR